MRGLPSQTTARFLMLVVAVLGTASFAYRLILVTVSEVAQRTACLAANPIMPTATLDAPDSGESDLAAQARAACLRPTELRETGHMLLGIGLVVAATLVLYWLLPLWDRYGRRLRRLDPRLHAEVLAELDVLVEQAGLARRPVFLYSLSRRLNANTFGWFPRYYVRIDGGLLTTFVSDRDAFRALIRHELAHLRHRDVDVTRLTVALSWAFPLVVLVPYVIDVVLPNAAQSLRNDTWRLAALAVLVYLSAASVLRARELAADAWAARGGAEDAAALARVLERQEQGAGLWWRLGELIGSHPRAPRRVAELANPTALVRAGFWEAAGAGLAAGIAAAPLFDVVSLAYRGSLDRLVVASLVAGAVIGALAAGVVGVARGGPPRRRWPPAAGRPNGLLPGLGSGCGRRGRGPVVAWQSVLNRRSPSRAG